jgi:hypothetical protein
MELLHASGLSRHGSWQMRATFGPYVVHAGVQLRAMPIFWVANNDRFDIVEYRIYQDRKKT